jgi:hypothetical protein
VERFTKITVTVWACAAIAEQAWLLRSWQNLPWLTLGAAIVSLVLGRLDRRTLFPICLVAYAFPALVRLIHGIDYPPFDVLWMAALLGAILPDTVRTPWQTPKRWKGALVFAALVVVISAVISFWREVDGTLTLIMDSGSMNFHGADPPSFPIRWILNVSLILVIGVLWFDWLCGAEGLDLERTIITPLVFSAMATAAVSAYQWFIDIHFLNEHAYGTIGRATGAMYDANLAGMLAAMWIGGTLLWAWRLRDWRVYVAPVGVVLNAIAVWASGSRTALMTATVVTLTSILSLVLHGPHIRPRRIAIGLGFGAAIIALLFLIASADSKANNPGARTLDMLTKLNTPMAFAHELWDRNGYGAAAVAMIQQHPLVGVGVGSYHSLVSDVTASLGQRLPPDNAQNWLRHQIAEFGFVGALGWIVWCVAFAAFVLIPRRAEPPDAWILRSTLVAFGFISLFGMPGMDVMVAFTFWTIAFWYVSLAGKPATTGPLGVSVWLGMAVMLTVFAVGTTSLAATTLRLPERQRRAYRPFSYGYAVPQPAGPDDGYRRTLSRAVALIDATSPWMAVSARLEKPSTDLRPVEVRVWCDGQVVLKAQLTEAGAVTGFVPIVAASKPVLLETIARRTSASRFSPFARDLGVLIKWEFVDKVPSEYGHYHARSMEGR